MINQEDARLIVKQLLSDTRAKVQSAQGNPINEIQPFELDLTNELTRDNAKKISFPFKTVYMEEATDEDTHIWLIPEDNEASRGAIKLEPNDVYSSEFGFKNCYVYWRAQAGKSCKLTFLQTSSIDKGSLYSKGGGASDEQGNTIELGGVTTSYDEETLIETSSQMVTNYSTSPNYLLPFKGINFGNKYPSYLSTITIGSASYSTFVVPNGYQLRIIKAVAENMVTCKNGLGLIMKKETGTGIITDEYRDIYKVTIGASPVTQFSTITKHLKLPRIFSLPYKATPYDLSEFNGNTNAIFHPDIISFTLGDLSSLSSFEEYSGQEFNLYNYVMKNPQQPFWVNESVIPAGNMIIASVNNCILEATNRNADLNFTGKNGGFMNYNTSIIQARNGAFDINVTLEATPVIPAIKIKFIAKLEQV